MPITFPISIVMIYLFDLLKYLLFHYFINSLFIHLFTHFYSDINECLDTSTCDVDTTNCENTPGSFNCVCKEGYERDGENCVGKLQD